LALPETEDGQDSLMSKFVDFIRWRGTPVPSSIAPAHRASVAPLQLREANAALHVSHTVGKPQWPRTNPETYHRDAYKKLTLVFRCVNLIASSLAEAPVRVYRDRDGDTETLPDHPMRRILSRPNPLMGEAGLIHQVATRMAVFGYGAIEIERSDAAVPVQLWPLRSEWLKPIPRDQDAYDWEYRVPGRGDVTIPADDIIVIPYAATGDGDPRGIGPLEVAVREYGLLNTMQDYLKAFFDGGALPVYGLILDPDADLTDDDAAVARQRWIEAINSAEPPFLESIKDIKRLSFDYNELAYVDLRDVSEIAICQAFGVPGSLVGQRFAQERNTFSNYAEARKSFYQDTVQKLWARIDDALTRGLLPELDPRGDVHLEFDVSRIDALQEDQQQRRTHLLEEYRSGALSKAEYRQAMGYPVNPADDVYMVPFNLIETPVGKPMRDTVYIAPTVEDKPDDDDDDDARALPAGTERRNKLPLERRDAIQQRSIRLYEQAGRKWAPLIDAYFQRQKDRVLALIPAQRSAAIETRDAVNIDLIDWDGENEELRDLIERLWSAMGEQAIADAEVLLGSAGAGPGSQWDLANPWVQDIIGHIAGRVQGITATTQGDIQRIVNDALAEGVTMDDLAERLTGLYEETYAGRSMTIARTESQVSYNLAQAQGYGQRGVTEVELLDNILHTTDPGSDGLTCAQRNGKIVPLADSQRHVWAEHPRGTLALAPVLSDWN
jgi:HK97 family phage portal protein